MQCFGQLKDVLVVVTRLQFPFLLLSRKYGSKRRDIELGFDCQFDFLFFAMVPNNNILTKLIISSQMDQLVVQLWLNVASIQ